MQQDGQDTSLTHKNRLGILCLSTLLLLLILLRLLLPQMIKGPDPSRQQVLQEAWTAYLQRDSMQPATTRQRTKPLMAADDHPGKLFFFDPNIADSTTLLQLGFQPRTIASLMRYRNKGGRFRQKEDLKKLYTLSANAYERLEAYIRIEDAHGNSNREARPTGFATSAREIIELNTAHADQLMQIKGIGPVLSARIVRFRDGLGGFFEIAQVQEVYGLPDSVFQTLAAQCRVEQNHLVKINLHTASATELSKHPYIDRKLAAALVRLRSEETIREIGQIKALALINDEKYRKIAPYLSVEPAGTTRDSSIRKN
jgi:competence protein ComEA